MKEKVFPRACWTQKKIDSMYVYFPQKKFSDQCVYKQKKLFNLYAPKKKQ